MTLTTEQRAKRRTTKINNRVAKSLPLFAGTSAISQFLTDEATQIKAVQVWDEINERYFAQLEQADLEWIEKAKAYRDQLSKLISPDALKQHDDHLAYLVEQWGAYQHNPVYIADYWHGHLMSAQPDLSTRTN